MKLSTEVIEMVNKASSAINALPPGRGKGCGAREEKRYLIKKLQTEILAARMKSVTWAKLAQTIKETTGVAISQTTLKRTFKEIEEENAAAQKADTVKEPRRYGIDYNL